MVHLFGKNHDEIGSLDKNLVLLTKGKVKIRYGRKYIDLLDNNGNINVKIPKILKKVDSKDDIVPDGIYLYDGDLYANIGGEIIQFTGSVEGDYLIYSSDLELTQEQIELVWKNLQLNKLEGLTLNEPLSSINNSGLNYPVDNVMLVFKNGNWQYVTYDPGNINNLEVSSSSGGGISSGQFSPETLKDLESETPFITNPLNWKPKDNEKVLDPDKINPNNNGIKVGAISTDHLISYGTEFKEVTKTVDNLEVVQDYSYPRYSDTLNTDLVNNHASGEGYENVVPTIGWVKKLIESGGTLGELLTALNDWNTLIQSNDTGGVLLHTHQNGQNYFSWRNSLDVILSWMTDVSSSGDVGKYLYCESYNNGYQYTWKEIPAPSLGDTLNEPLTGINNASLGAPNAPGLMLATEKNLNDEIVWNYKEVLTSDLTLKDIAESRKQLLEHQSPPGTLIMTLSNTVPFGWKPYDEMNGCIPIGNTTTITQVASGTGVSLKTLYYWERIGEPQFIIELSPRGGNLIIFGGNFNGSVYDTYEKVHLDPVLSGHYIVDKYLSILNTNISSTSQSTFELPDCPSGGEKYIIYPQDVGNTNLFNNSNTISLIRIRNLYELKSWDLGRISNVVLESTIGKINATNFNQGTNNLTLTIQNVSVHPLIVNGANPGDDFLNKNNRNSVIVRVSSSVVNYYHNSMYWSLYTIQTF